MSDQAEFHELLRRVRGGDDAAAAELPAAEEQLRKALELRRAALGPNEPETLDTQNTLGVVLLNRGKHDEALTLLREALKSYESSLGGQHLTTLAARLALRADADHACAVGVVLGQFLVALAVLHLPRCYLAA